MTSRPSHHPHREIVNGDEREMRLAKKGGAGCLARRTLVAAQLLALSGKNREIRSFCVP